MNDDADELKVAREWLQSKSYQDVIALNSTRIGGLNIPPLTLGGYLELQIRNSPLFSGIFPDAGPEHIERLFEALSVFIGKHHDFENDFELLTPHDAFQAWLVVKEFYLEALSSMGIIGQHCGENMEVSFGRWGNILVTLVNELKLPISDAMSLPLVTSFARTVALSIKISREPTIL